MLKILSKMVFWSALAVLFCISLGQSSQAFAVDNSVAIFEVYFNPVGSDSGKEWVKLYNPTGADIDLKGYGLYAGHYYYFLDNSMIKSNTIITIRLKANGDNTDTDFYQNSISGSDLGNTYGEVALFKGIAHNETDIIDYVKYGEGEHSYYHQEHAVDAGIWKNGDSIVAVDEGHSIMLTDKSEDNNSPLDWVDNIVVQPVIEEENIILSDDEEVAQIPISEARQKTAGEYVKISGVVTILPSNLSNQYFYIEDASGGIQIYCYKKDFPTLATGDLIEVIGQIGDYYTDKRVKISSQNDIKIIAKSDLPEVKKVEINQIDDSLIGKIVEFEGEVSSTSGSTFYLENEVEIKINIREQTNIDKPRMAVGDKVRIVGVVTKYKNSYQVLPFDQAGVTILTSGKLPVGGKANSDLFNSMLILSLWKLSPKVKKKLKSLQKTMPKV